MEDDLEKINQLRQINAKISRFMVWHVIVCMLFVIPACLVIIVVGFYVLSAASEIATSFKCTLLTLKRFSQSQTPTNVRRAETRVGSCFISTVSETRVRLMKAFGMFGNGPDMS